MAKKHNLADTLALLTLDLYGIQANLQEIARDRGERASLRQALNHIVSEVDDQIERAKALTDDAYAAEKAWTLDPNMPEQKP